MEVPLFLRSDFRVLENTAFKIRKKNPGAKTNIKFDDLTLSLLLDFNTGKEWRTATVARSRRVCQATADKETVDDETLSSLVS